jgi:hypothetical protein
MKNVRRIIVMPSRMMKTKTARKIRQARKGKPRKRMEQNKGTTPKFAIHKNAANASPHSTV